MGVGVERVAVAGFGEERMRNPFWREAGVPPPWRLKLSLAFPPVLSVAQFGGRRVHRQEVAYRSFLNGPASSLTSFSPRPPSAVGWTCKENLGFTSPTHDPMMPALHSGGEGAC